MGGIRKVGCNIDDSANFEHLGDLGRNDPWHGKVFKTRQRKDEVEFFIGRKVGR